MKLQITPYQEYEKNLPQTGNFILGQEYADSIIVYQAFNHTIADYAIQHQKFGGNAYRFSRMTWIKPNFLWMMYRSGWATKPNQERILAIRITKAGFYKLLELGVHSSFQAKIYDSQADWKKLLQESDVRIQWDPDHDPKGGKLERRAIQIGIGASVLEEFNQHWIREIIDLTDFVEEQYKKMKMADSFFVIHESVIEIPIELKQKIHIK